MNGTPPREYSLMNGVNGVSTSADDLLKMLEPGAVEGCVEDPPRSISSGKLSISRLGIRCR